MSKFWSKTRVALSLAGMGVLPACALDDAAAPEVTIPTPATASEAAALSGPVGQWVWSDVAGAECGYGQQTGIAVNKGTGSDLLISMEGGGLCWDGASCALDIPGFAQLASYFTNG